MNSKQLQYAVLLSDMGNFSTAAEKLNISQPALSKQILNLEKELGVQLFDRSKNPICLTPAGEHFISAAKDLLYRETQLIKSLEQFKVGSMGSLVIGITPFRSSYMIPKIIKDLHTRFPGIQIKLRECGSEILRKEAAEGKFDFAVVNLPVDESLFDVTLMEPDSLAIVLHNNLIGEHPHLKDRKEIEFNECKDLPFVVVSPAQEMRKLFENFCITSDIKPKIAAEVINLTTAWQMASLGLGATMLPLQFVNSEFSDDKLTIIKVKNTANLRQPAILTLKNQYISPYAQYAIKLLTQN